MAKKTSRRNFLRTAPIAAAAGFTLTDSLMAMAQAAPGADVIAAAQPIKLFKASELADDMKALDAKPGDNRLYDSKSIPVQIIDGSTLYEVGGTPTGTKVMPGVGEWHATGATGSKSILLVKGDVLLIPRGTLHKRSTEDSVTFLLISNPAPAKA